MHWNVEQILWALVLAGHLVLLIVLLGRDRVSRFPWFTAAAALAAVHLIADHLLQGKLITIYFYWQSYAAVLLGSILGILVLVELGRHVFSSGRAGIVLNAKGWLGWSLVTGAIAVGAVWLWGPWPTWQGLSQDKEQLPLLLFVLTAMKSQLFLAILTVEIALLLRIRGRRFGSRWSSHAQQIALGLSTYSLGYLVVLGTTDIVKRTVHLTSRDEYEHVVRLFTRLDNARFALWFLVIVWWIVWLWRDEPEVRPDTDTAEFSEAPVLTDIPLLEAEIPTDIEETTEPGS